MFKRISTLASCLLASMLLASNSFADSDATILPNDNSNQCTEVELEFSNGGGLEVLVLLMESGFFRIHMPHGLIGNINTNAIVLSNAIDGIIHSSINDGDDLNDELTDVVTKGNCIVILYEHGSKSQNGDNLVIVNSGFNTHVELADFNFDFQTTAISIINGGEALR